MPNFIILNWVKISIIRKTKFVQDILIFILLIPIVSKILENFGNEITFVINNKEHIINISLPFSLGLFYFAAIAFLVGNILYKIYVPEIIDENKSFTDFFNDGKNKIHIVKYHENSNIDSELDYSSLYLDDKIDRDELSEIFWELWDKSKDINKITRGIISFFYLIAILIIIFLFIQNICYVIKTMDLLSIDNKILIFILNIGK